MREAVARLSAAPLRLGLVFRVAHRAVHLEQVGERQVLQDRRVQLGVDLARVIAAAGVRGRNIRAEALPDHRVGVEPSALLAILDADREPERTAGQLEQLAGDVCGRIPQILLAAVVLDEGHIIDHFRGDRSGAAEQVERHAAVEGRARRTARRAGGEVAEGKAQFLGVDVAEHALLGLVVAVDAVDVPIPVAAGDVEAAVERADDVARVHLLREAARPAFDEPAQDHIEVARVRDRPRMD